MDLDRISDLQKIADAAHQHSDHQTVRDALTELHALTDHVPLKYRAMLAGVLIADKHYDLAADIVDEALAIQPDYRPCLFQRAQIRAEQHWERFEIDEALETYRQFALAFPDMFRPAARFCEMATEVGGPAMVCDFMNALKAAGGTISLLASATIFHRLGDETVIEPLCERLRSGARLSARHILNVYSDLGQHAGDRLKEALAASQNPASRDEARYLEDLLGQSPPDESLLRPAKAENFHETLSWAPEPDPAVSPDPEAICVVFSGGAHSFGVPSDFFDRYLARRGMAAVYLRDPKRLVGHAGLPGLGDDRTSAALALRDRLRARGYKRIYTIGVSLGGFWAMSYGLIMGAQAMMGFGAMTYLDRATMTAQKETRAPHYAHRLWQCVGQAGLNLREEMERYAVLPATHLYFTEHAQDTKHAEALAQFDAVTLHQELGLDSHAVSVELKRIGRFDGALDAILPR